MINLVKVIKTTNGSVNCYDADTIADRDSLKDPVIGTQVYVIDEAKTYKSDSNGIWYEVVTASSGGGGGGGEGGDLSNYYNKQQVNAKIQGAEAKTKKEEERAIAEETRIESKFNDYTKTSDLPKIKVNNAINADTATKAIQDSNGNSITDTYATIANTYNKDEIDAKVSSVYKYKGSVATKDDLPLNNQIGDVYDVREDGMNYAWNGFSWDALGSSIDLTPYLTKEEAGNTYATQDNLRTTNEKFNNYALKNEVISSTDVDNKIKVETDRAIKRENEIEAKIGEGGGIDVNNYYTKQEVNDKIKNEVPLIKVNEAVKATKDGNGKIISDTYATKENTYNKDEVDAKVSSVYKYKGSVATFDDLPSKHDIGDVYDVKDTGANYAWDGTAWDALGFKVDLTDYLKKDDADKIYSPQTALTAEVNRATARENEINDKFINYALKENTISSKDVDNKITVETNRATERENEIDNKFANYTITSELSKIKVNNAVTADNSLNSDNATHSDNADTATKAIQDGNGNVIADTYATKENTYTKEEVDGKVSKVYKYKGSVDTYKNLPTENQIGDVYDVKDTGINYAWNGTAWDGLGGNIDLTDYLTKEEAGKTYSLQSSLTAESERAVARENEINDNFSNFTPTVGIPNIKVNEATLADKATQDDKGNVISTTYATDANLTIEKDRAVARENEIDGKFANYQLTSSAVKLSDIDEKVKVEADRATKAEGEINASLLAETGRATGEEARIEGKFADYITATVQTEKDDAQDKALSAEIDRAKKAEKVLEEKINAGGGGGGGEGLPTDSYYTKTQIDEKLEKEVPLIKVNNAITADKANQDGLGNVIDVTYALKTDIISTDIIDGKVQAEAERATGRENEIEGKFADYTKTNEISKIKVDSSTNADNATKATQDNLGNVITDTYATKENTYTREEIDNKVSSVYKYKGSVEKEINLPKENNTIGDVYDVKENGANYAWDGKAWDKLGDTIDLTPYLTKEIAKTVYATKGELTLTNEKFNDYTKTSEIHSINVDKATQATQDGNGAIIADTYALKGDVVSAKEIDEKILVETNRASGVENGLASRISVLEGSTGPDLTAYVKAEDAEKTYAKISAVEAIDAKFADYTKSSEIHKVLVDFADKAIHDRNGNVIVDTYATKADTYTKEEIDNKVSQVYKYKGSVVNYDALPKADQVIGDVYNVEDTGDNYAWDGKQWDKLAGTVNLTEYLKKEEASSTYITPGEVDAKLSPYAKTSDLATATVQKANEADTATKATQDSNGNVIADTYATKDALNETDAKFANYATAASLSAYVKTNDLKNATVKKAGTADEATKATQDGNGNVIADTYALTSDLTAEISRAEKAEGGLDTRLSLLEAGGGGTAPDLKDYLRKEEAKTTYATIASVETVDGKFKDYATTLSVDNKLKNYATTASLSSYATKSSVEAIDAKFADYATTEALGIVDAKFANYATTKALGETNAKFANYATTASLATASVKKAESADSATKATQDGAGNVIATTYVKTVDLKNATVKKAGAADEATKATQDGNGNVIADTYATIANTYDKETIDGKLTSVYKFKGSVANFAALPKEGQTVGDVWDTLDTGTNYAWTGKTWDSLGGSSVDLSEYLKSTDAANTYATKSSVETVDAKFADYTPSTDIHSIIVDTATKAIQDGNGAVIADTYLTNETLTTKLGDYATTASLADATVKKSGETDSITNMVATEGPWKINFNSKGAANNPANFLWFDTKNNQIRNANTKSLNVNHSLKATQDNKGNVIDTFYAKGADLTALDERVAAIEAGGGGGTGPDLKDYYKKSETYSQAEVNDAIKVETDRATGVEGKFETRIAALEAGGGGGAGPDLKDYLKTADAEKTYAKISVVNGIDDRVKELEAGGGGGGGTSGGNYVKTSGYEIVKGQGTDLDTPPSDCFFIEAKDWKIIKNGPATKFSVNVGGGFFMQYSCGKNFILQEVHTLPAPGQAQCFNFHRAKSGNQWTNWVKAAFNEW